MIGKAFDDHVGRAERPETFARELDYVKPTTQAGQDVQPDGINLQLIKLRDKINVLHEVFSVLEQKTSSICKPMPCKEQCPTDTSDGSEIQRFLKEQNQRLDALFYRIEYMCESIDL